MQFNLHLIGCSFKQAQLEKVSRVQWREPAQINDFLHEARRDFDLKEIFYLQTCNRREFYCHGLCLEKSGESFLPRFLAKLGESLGCMLDLNDFYHMRNATMVRHFFCVASSLDSMVLGETEIIKQIKDQVSQSIKSGHMGPRLKAMVDLGLGVSKQVRHQTRITQKVVSLGSLAYLRVMDHLVDKPKRRVVFVGAGHFIRSLLPTFQKAKDLEILLVNRTLPKELAQRYQARAISLADFLVNPPEFEAMITATGSSQPLFDSTWVTTHAPKGLIIDAALPRDVSLDRNLTDAINYLDLGQLEEVLATNRAARESEIPRAEPFFRGGLQRLRDRWLEFALSGYSQEISTHYQDVGERALKHLLKEVGPDLSPDSEQALRDWTQSLMGRLTNIPILGLKGVARELGSDAVAAYTRGVSSQSNLFKP